MSKDAFKLTKLTLTTRDGREVGLSVQEAKDLFDQLNELFGPKYTYQTPIIIERDQYVPYWDNWRPMWSTTCGTTNPTAAGHLVTGSPMMSCSVKGTSGLGLRLEGKTVAEDATPGA